MMPSTFRAAASRLSSWNRLALGLAVLVGSLALLARPAGAHATLVGTTPSTDAVLDDIPAAVRLEFDEPVSTLQGGVRVLGPTGERVDLGLVESEGDQTVVVAPIDSDRRGTYTVAWRTVSEDGHDLSGSFVFHVGEQTGAVDVAEADTAASEVAAGVGRFAAFAGSLATAGAILVAGLASLERPVTRRAAAVAAVAATAAAVGVAVVLVAETAQVTGRSLPDAVGLTPDIVAETRTGLLQAVRLALVLIAAVAAGLAVIRSAALPVAGAAIMGVLGVTAAAGHAWTAPERWLAVTVDLVHLVAVAVWVGGFTTLLFVLGVTADRRSLGRRFSATALVAAAAAGATGIAAAAIQIRSVEALTATDYGRLVLVKVLGFAALVSFGWINRSRLVGLLDRTTRPLRSSLRTEVAIAVAVLAATAVLVDQPPARVQLSEPFTAVVEAAGATLSVSVEPGHVGTNDIHLYLFEPGGGPPLDVDAVEITAGTTDIPPRRLPVTAITGNHWSAYGASLTAPGTWTVEVTAVRAGSPITASFEVPLR